MTKAWNSASTHTKTTLVSTSVNEFVVKSALEKCLRSLYKLTLYY